MPEPRWTVTECLNSRLLEASRHLALPICYHSPSSRKRPPETRAESEPGRRSAFHAAHRKAIACERPDGTRESSLVLRRAFAKRTMLDARRNTLRGSSARALYTRDPVQSASLSFRGSRRPSGACPGSDFPAHDAECWPATASRTAVILRTAVRPGPRSRQRRLLRESRSPPILCAAVAMRVSALDHSRHSLTA